MKEHEQLKDIGTKYGKLLVVDFIKKDKHNHRIYKCLCECGKEKNISIYSLRNGGTKSCGCIQSIKRRLNGISNKKHGLTHTRIYNIYRGILARCNNRNNPNYKDYGGRGIYCDWKTFEDFYEDMKEGYNDSLQIDRINNDGNYFKNNCRWVTSKINTNNRRSNRVIEYKGQVKTISEWSEYFGIKYRTMLGRLRYGWSMEKIENNSLKNENGGT